MVLVLPLLIPLVTAAVLMAMRGWLTAQRWLSLAASVALLVTSILLTVDVYTQGIVSVQVGSWPAPFGITLVADMFSALMVNLAGVIAVLVTIYAWGSSAPPVQAAGQHGWTMPRDRHIRLPGYTTTGSTALPQSGCTATPAIARDHEQDHSTATGLHRIDDSRQRHGYWPLVQVLLLGVCGAFLTGDLFNLYVWFEVLLLASFVLASLGGDRRQLSGAVVYVILNLLSSLLFLVAVGLLYGNLGTLNMADIAAKLSAVSPAIPAQPVHAAGQHGWTMPRSPSVHLQRHTTTGSTALQHSGCTATPAIAHDHEQDQSTATRLHHMRPVLLLLVVSFGIKAAAFPLFFWLPAVYDRIPYALSALFAALMTKVGVYALARVYTLFIAADDTEFRVALMVVAACTMVFGVLCAVAQNDIRRILAYHSVSQVGYMLMGLAIICNTNPVSSVAALSGMIVFALHHSVVKGNLFLISGLIYEHAGTGDLKKLGGLYAHKPLLAGLFLVTAISLAGLPPLSGFFSKMVLIKAAFELHHWALAVVALAVGMLTLFSMTKIWAYAFWTPPGSADFGPRESNIRQPCPTSTSNTPYSKAVTPPDQEPSSQVSDDNHVRPAISLILQTVPVVVLVILTAAMGVGIGPLLKLTDRAAEQMLAVDRYINVILGAVQ